MTCRPGIVWDQTHHTGCACYEKKRSGETERLRAENARLRAALDAALARAEDAEAAAENARLGLPAPGSACVVLSREEHAALLARAAAAERDLTEAEQGHAAWREHYTRTLAERDAARAEAARYRAALEEIKGDKCIRVDPDGQLRPCREMAGCPRPAWCASCIAARALEGEKP